MSGSAEVPTLSLSALDAEGSSNAAAPASPAVASPVARGDVSPTSGQLTFELLPAAVVEGKPKKHRGGRKGGGRGRGRRGGGRRRKGGNGGDGNSSSSSNNNHNHNNRRRSDFVLKKLEHCFSPTMLSSETFLRRNMDQNGYVPVWCIAQLPEFSTRGPSIYDQLRGAAEASTTLTYDAGNDLVRLTQDWQKWLFPMSSGAMWGPQWHIFGVELAPPDAAGQEEVVGTAAGFAGGVAATDDGSANAVGAAGEQQQQQTASAGGKLSATAAAWVPRGASS